jgi:hypothetical protein
MDRESESAIGHDAIAIADVSKEAKSADEGGPACQEAAAPQIGESSSHETHA